MPEPADLTAHNAYYQVASWVPDSVNLNSIERIIWIIEQESHAAIASMKAELAQLRVSKPNPLALRLLALDAALAWLFQDQVKAALAPQGLSTQTVNQHLDNLVRGTNFAMDRVKHAVLRDAQLQPPAPPPPPPMANAGARLSSMTFQAQGAVSHPSTPGGASMLRRR